MYVSICTDIKIISKAYHMQIKYEDIYNTYIEQIDIAIIYNTYMHTYIHGYLLLSLEEMEHAAGHMDKSSSVAAVI